MAFFRFSDGAGEPAQHPFSSTYTITVTHGLNYIPNVWILDNNSKIVIGEITYNNLLTFTVTFATQETGVIYYR